MSNLNYEISAEEKHPLKPEVRFTLTPHLIEELVEKYLPLKHAIEQQRKREKGSVSVMELIGDHVISYVELNTSSNGKIIFFLPLTLTDADIQLVFNSTTLIPYYRQLVTVAKSDPNYTKGKVIFVPIKKG